MTTVGCTGHQSLSIGTRRRVAGEIAAYLATVTGELVGICSLAGGADQIFAHALLAAGGQLHAIVPSANFDESFPRDDNRTTFTHLLEQAAERTDLAFPAPTEEAFMAAGKALADTCEVLLAVWDGKQAAGLGGTADVVAYAQEQGRHVIVVWPPGSSRY
jgi:hypothetical protein